MVKKVRCIKAFEVFEYDEDEFLTENKYYEVPQNSIWELDETGYRIADGEIRLEDNDADWLEISKETFNEYFEYIREESDVKNNENTN